MIDNTPTKYVAVFARYETAIGNADTNDLLVYDREDLEHFKAITHEKVLIAGRKTVDSLPKRLKDRYVICLTTDPEYSSDKCNLVLHSKEDVLEYCEAFHTVYVIGGSKTLGEFSDVISEMIVTKYHPSIVDVECTNFIYLPISIRKHLVMWNKVTLARTHRFDIDHYFKYLEK